MVGLLFDEDLCIVKGMFNYDQSTFDKKWIGTLKDVEKYQQEMRENTFTDKKAFRDYVDRSPELNEALVKLSKDGILGLWVASQNTESKIIALQRQRELFTTFNQKYGIFLYDNKENTVTLYTEAQQILDITGINIEENSEHKKYFEAILKTDETIFNNESIESKLLAKLLDNPLGPSYLNLKLIEAAKYGLASIVQEFLKHKDKLKLNQKDRQELTALMWAAYSGHLNIVQELLKQDGATTDDLSSNTTLKNRFIEAAKTGNLKIIQAMLEIGIDVNLKDSGGYSALMRAASNGHLSIVQELLKQPHLSQDQVFEAYDWAKDTTLKKSLRDSILDSIKNGGITILNSSKTNIYSESLYWHIKRQAPYDNNEDIRQNYLSRFVMIDTVKSGTALIVLAIGVSMAATAQILAASLSLDGTIVVSTLLILFSLLYLGYKISSHYDAYQESKTNLSPTITNN